MGPVIKASGTEYSGLSVNTPPSNDFHAAIRQARAIMGEVAWINTTPLECKEAIEKELRTLREGSLAQGPPPDRAGSTHHNQSPYQGLIEQERNGWLFGWCRLIDADEPVELELSLDGRYRKNFLADEFRPDLIKAGFSTGHHGFRIELPGPGLMRDAVVRIKVSKDGVELENSGRALRNYSPGTQPGQRT
jgi:hypothetical protein